MSATIEDLIAWLKEERDIAQGCGTVYLHNGYRQAAELAYSDAERYRQVAQILERLRDTQNARKRSITH